MKIDDFREEMQPIFMKDIDDFMKKLNNCKEEIILAFIAKYGLQPDEVRLCYQENTFWVDKIEFVKPTPEYKKAVNALRTIAEGSACNCENECAKCHAIQALQEIEGLVYGDEK